MKVLWMGDAGCHTGFARVTHSIGERLVRDYHHEVHALAVNYRGDSWPSTITPGGVSEIRLYKTDTVVGGDTYGASRVVELLGSIEPDVVVMLGDAPVILRMLFGNKQDPNRILLQYRPILSYVPVDGVNLPPAWTNLIPKVTKMIAMSEWGVSQYGDDVELVYHGVDTDVFWPIHEKPIKIPGGATLRTKRECKRAFGFDPSGFLVLRVDKNSGRKDYAATWKALVPIMKRYRDIEVHFHCESNGMAIDLNSLFSREPSIDRNRFFSPDFHNSYVGWSVEELNALYNAADIFVSTSRGEGFGLTIAEALACGVPVVAQNVSAIPEVVGPGGILVEPGRLITVPSGEDTWLADVEAFSQAIERLYLSAGARRDLGEAGVEHVRRSFNWDAAASRFNEFIVELATRQEEAA